MTEKHYGAKPAEWACFIGLAGEDLLPVVSNPGAQVSPRSKMKSLGKTPSVYNDERQVVGIIDWTAKKASPADLARWRAEADYGICLQTRGGKGAFDIDGTDPERNREIAEFIEQHLGFPLPRRTRPNSPKCALLFQTPGPRRGKRILKLSNGERLECLGHGNQLIVAGTHPSGARYEWPGGLPDSIPIIEPLIFERLWTALCDKFGDGEVRSAMRRQRGGNVLPDPVADYLEEKGIATGTGMEGQIFFECPFANEHTTESGPSSTAYFPRGTRGYERGHFKCLHAHCAERKDEDFLNAMGYEINGFESLPALRTAPALPALERNDDGSIKAVMPNLIRALRRPDMCFAELRHDVFRDELMIKWGDVDYYRPLTDSDYTALQLVLEEGRDASCAGTFKTIRHDALRRAVILVAEQNRYDSAQEWLKSLKWDGKPRIETFYRDYLRAEDTPYARALGLYQFTAMAGRVMEPGCKVDMVPIWVGPQGIRKSTGVAALSPTPDFFCELDLTDRDDNLIRLQRGRLVAEFGELKGLHSRDIESIKSFISRTHDSWVPKYREYSVNYARRIFYIGTTNRDEFLADETGNRRWLPVRVEKVDPDAILSDREQLWAEGRDIFDVMGVCFSQAEILGRQEHEEYRIGDSWEEVVREWLTTIDLDGSTPSTRSFLQAHEVLRGALGYDPRSIKIQDEQRVGRVLRQLGYAPRRKRVENRMLRSWVKG